MGSRNSQVAQVGKRQIEISNLAKPIFPDDHIVKAQLIQYYLTIAPTILAHVKGRPLSLVRYPEGIQGESFFQKNRPGWAPDWVEHITLGAEAKDYVIATEAASLAWLANLACIELHQMHSRAPHYDKPDYIVYDFDPPETFKFKQVAEMTMEFREYVERFGYHTFIKTTGRKGLHLLTPIEPRWGFDKAFETAKTIAEPFVQAHDSSMTLLIKKEFRKNKLLLDVYRNRQSQTIISAYSVRGLPGAPVSTPLRWEELSSLESPKALNLLTVPQRVTKSGDPWETMDAYAVPLHTEKTTVRPLPALPPSRTRKTAEQLQEYSDKRSFDKTREPPPSNVIGSGSAFVVHRHHATRLHYDLRLERNGVLKSWAVPKGLPPRPGIMRLAVQVEDHPLEYVAFEGAIPKGEYGGGMMWKYAQGRYEVTRQKKDGFYFRLQSPELNAEYRMHNTEGNQWLLERVDTPQTEWLRDRIEPMMAGGCESLPRSDDYVYEVKWDGIRALISLDEGTMQIYGRNGTDFTKAFPELLVPDEAFRATSALFDGEIVCLDAAGKPEFQKVIQRMQQTTERGVERGLAKNPAVCYVFDCLYLDGRPIINEPLARRREWLQDALKRHGCFRMSEAVDQGEAFLAAVRELGLEGVVAKRRDSLYLPGRRSDNWLKLKMRQTIECVIAGFTRGKGDREQNFGALHLVQRTGGQLQYLGKVGGGFDEHSLAAVWAELSKLPRIDRPVKERPLDDARSTWVEPRLVCEVQFASLTADGRLREPLFLRLRPDLTAAI